MAANRPPDAPAIQVQVVCALRERQVCRTLFVARTCSVAEAVRRSAVLDEFPQLDRQQLSYALFGVGVEASQGLRDGDRVEILRGLEVDPREARRRRADNKKRRAGPRDPG